MLTLWVCLLMHKGFCAKWETDGPFRMQHECVAAYYDTPKWRGKFAFCAPELVNI